MMLEARRKADGLKKLARKRDAYRLQDDLPAWNIDGSATDKLYGGTSWIKHWEESTGLRRRRCAFSDCDRDAEYGGHIWIKAHSSQKRGVWIVPICKKCNFCENTDRMRDADGQHSFLRKGTVVVNTDYTPDMANAARRVASYAWYDEDGYDSDEYEEDDWDGLVCEYCYCDLPFGTPEYHTKCTECFRRGAPPCRRCEGCDADISSRPTNFKQCLDCYRGGNRGGGRVAKRPRGRRCEGCDADISSRPANYKQCLDCYRGGNRGDVGAARRPRSRRCEGCDVDISSRPANFKLCLDCYRW